MYNKDYFRVYCEEDSHQMIVYKKSKNRTRWTFKQLDPYKWFEVTLGKKQITKLRDKCNEILEEL